MNNSPAPSGQRFISKNSNIVKVQIPDVELANSRRQTNLAATMSRTLSNRIDTLRPVSVGATCTDESSPDCCGVTSTAEPSSVLNHNNIAQKSHDFGTKSVDRVIESILKTFPLDRPATIVFVACKNSIETDNVTLSLIHI